MEPLVEIICFCFILLVALILRAIPHVKYHFPGTPDTFFFLNKIKNPEYLSEEVLYPKLFDQTLRFFVQRERITDGRTTNRLSIIVDIITTTIIYMFLRGQFTAEISLLTAILFVTTPLIVKQGSTLSARSFGLLFASTSILSVTLPFPWNWFTIVPIAITLLSHRLSSQALFFVFVALSFLDVKFPLIFAVGFIFAVIVSKGEYIIILRAHISAIIMYFRKRGYPNDRLVGIFFTPTCLGYVLYLLLFIIQWYSHIPLAIGTFIIPELISVNALFESVMIIWALVCFLLLIFWVAGESYKHLSIASVPFAFLTSLLAFTDSVFMVLTMFLIIGSLIQSLYFQLRYENIDKDLVELLTNTPLVEIRGTMFAPSKVYRAVSFFTECQVVPVNLHLYDQEHFDKRFSEFKPTLAIEEKKYGYWYSGWEEVASSADWVIYKLK